MGANQAQLRRIEEEIRKVVSVISWKKLGRIGTKLIHDLILTSKIRYATTQPEEVYDHIEAHERAQKE